jgi:LmbE family N-acetylglucosaminyl deacetylase
MTRDARRVAFAIAAHPDDIEFMMAGTLILLKQTGFEIHYMNIANGSCGTATLSREEIIATRETEGRSAAELIGAVFHPSLCDDIEILYTTELLSQVGAIFREINPTIVLVPSLQDYMEDHMNAARLAITAAFCREMPNFPTTPPRSPIDSQVTLYHGLPYGLRDGMRRPIRPELYVDIGSVFATKRDMLAMHRSQKEWLDESQGLDAYLKTMEGMAAEVGRMSGRFKHAEGWRRHSHLGFCEEDDDPLSDALGDLVAVDHTYREQLERA